MQLALYKGKGNLINSLIRFWNKSIYSHCEVIIDGWAYSSSVTDRGVRKKITGPAGINLESGNWDVVDIKFSSKQRALQWFEENAGQPYGWIDVVFNQILSKRFDGRGVFCSAACAEMLDLPDANAYNPGMLGNIVKFINERVENGSR